MAGGIAGLGVFMNVEFENEKSKAVYTATSCGRVGRGGKVRFHTFQLERDGPTDRPTDRRTDKAGYRVACTRLKTFED